MIHNFTHVSRVYRHTIISQDPHRRWGSVVLGVGYVGLICSIFRHIEFEQNLYSNPDLILNAITHYNSSTVR